MGGEEPRAGSSGTHDILSRGTIMFNNENTSKRAKLSAKFAVVSHQTPKPTLISLLEETWQLPSPSVLISVTGSAELKMEHTLKEFVRHGLASAARSTSAWVFTGGTDSGVMALTGAAMRQVITDSSRGLQGACIGIAPWSKVTHKEKFYVRPSRERQRCGSVDGDPSPAPPPPPTRRPRPTWRRRR